MLLQPAASEAIGELGVYPPLLISAMLLVAGIMLGASVGMWRGDRWGWWLGAFIQVFGVVRNLPTLVMIPGMEDPLGEQSEAFEMLIVRVIGRSVISLLLILYFFKANVLAYFGLEDVNRAMALVALVVASTVLMVALVGFN